MTFSDALEAVKMGARIRRAGWVNMWVALTPAHAFPLEVLEAEDPPVTAVGVLALELREVGKSTLIAHAHLDQKAADGSLVIGWGPTQVDTLAEDWEVLDARVFEVVAPADEAEEIANIIGTWLGALPPIRVQPARAIRKALMAITGALTPITFPTTSPEDARRRTEHALRIIDGIITTAAMLELNETREP